MKTQIDKGPTLGTPAPVEDLSLAGELKVKDYVIAQARVFATGILGLDDVLTSGFPGRIGLLRCGDRLVIVIGCRDSHGGIAERACQTLFRVWGGSAKYDESFGGGIFTVDQGGITIGGTSGDLGQIKNEALRDFAASKLWAFICEHYPKG